MGEHFIWSISPTLLELGPLQLRWYGLLFVGSFFLGMMILHHIYRLEKRDDKDLDNLLLYLIIGTIVGARLMHTLAYEPSYYLANPIDILKVWHGGLASHGGMMGVILALYLYTKRYRIPFWWLLARLSIAGALTAAFVRFGNFFNSEILGLPSDLPWAVIFSRVDMIPRHPVQLYEAFAYLILVAILWSTYKRVSASFATRILPAIFFLYMFSVRFLLEYTKTKQANHDTSQWLFSTGQFLSIPFIILGVVWFVWAIRARE
jgi:phosphatidylglycerol:prolipoprotein diacylglycerol transferase